MCPRSLARRRRRLAFAWLSFVPAGLAAQHPAPADSLYARLVVRLASADATLAARRVAMRAAEARVGAAGAVDPASLVFEVDGVPDALDFTHAQQARIQIERSLFTGSRRDARRTSAAIERDAARLELVAMERAFHARLDREVARWLGWSAIAERLAAEDTLLIEMERALNVRFAAGDARYVDVLRLRTERLRVQAERVEAAHAARRGRRAIEGTIAVGDPATRELQLLLDSLAAARPRLSLVAALPPALALDSLWLESGALARIGLGVARARAESARVRVDGRSQVTGAIGLQRFQASDGAFSLGPALAATVSLPFTASGSRRAERAAADAGVALAEADRVSAEANLRAAVDVARGRYDAALERVRIFDAALLVGALQERESALAAFRDGQLSLLELLDFERALARAEIARLQATIDAADAYADLYLILTDVSMPSGAAADLETRHD